MATLYFYDLETSGVNPKASRVMQFAGQRTDLKLEPIGEPDNYLIRMTNDILPEPDAVMLTGITPQATLDGGLTEAEFLQYFTDDISVPGTIFVGFNTIRFDDEFIRFMLYRNFYDAYEWQWRDKRSRWDILDAVRMMRALRPDGIKWPVTPDGKPTNRLELLTSMNNLMHEAAHDALSDVYATIAVARMIHDKQPKLFDYLLKMRDKNAVSKMVLSGEPFVYSSGKYANAYEKTSVVVAVGNHPSGAGAFVYDLRTDPDQFADMDAAELAKAMSSRPKDELLRFPVKSIRFNRCPAIAPLSVLDEPSIKRLKLDMDEIAANQQKLAAIPGFYEKLCEAVALLDQKRQANLLTLTQDVDFLLYDGFFDETDKTKMSVVRAADRDEIAKLKLKFKDSRLTHLWPLYKARNFPEQMTPEDLAAWEKFRYDRLMNGGEKSLMSRYFKRLDELQGQSGLPAEKLFLLEQLRQYGEHILPSPSP
jgi:exodeoxyribonuclease-1